MKKLVLFAAVAALVLASCAKTETYVKATFDDAVTFGAYSGRTITKGGPTDDMNLKALAQHGFGVFATYSGTNVFSEATNDFMSNQQVTSADEGSTWTYSPIKYWPNPTNGQAADAQKVSFFAYAPYADDAAIADNTYGITGFSIDATTKHNLLSYTFSKDKPNVDLMWGYKTKTIDNTDPTNPVVTYTINDNLTRTTDNVKFIFQHLLSKLGGSQEGNTGTPNPYEDASYVANGLVVKASPVSDPTAQYGDITLGDFGGDKGTKITISKIVIGSAPVKDAVRDTTVTDIDGNGISYADADQTGTLDLYTGEFEITSPKNIKFSQTITNKVDDPATPEDESTNSDSELADFLKEPASVTSFAALPKGVVKKAINVYKDESNPIILVPGTKPVIDITVTYVVRTYDEKLPAGYSEVPQTVFGRIKFGEIKKNTKYNIVMILGLNNVKFEANVQEWSTEGEVWNDLDGDGEVDPGEVTPGSSANTEIGLPSNL
jgi:hypothetical protein